MNITKYRGNQTIGPHFDKPELNAMTTAAPAAVTNLRTYVRKYVDQGKRHKERNPAVIALSKDTHDSSRHSCQCCRCAKRKTTISAKD